ncbi:protein takeout-like [Temnothorax nylanderi]|uniref:protein takeout-like n=1 Tax=Temnothorax nylanderi TaxID=102681 RepID=UPI003A847458
MFAFVFAFALIAGNYVLAEIPSYIHVCNGRDPKLDQCILENIDNIKDKICEGIPELDLEPNDPFLLDRLVISDNPNSKIAIRDAKVSGLCDFVIKYLRTDLDKLHFDVELLFRQIQMNATYDFDIRLLIPIVQQGPVYMTTDNVEAKVNMDMKIVTKGGKRYVYMSKMKINLDIKGYDAEYGLDNTELSRLNQVISNFIGNNQQEVINAFKPAIEEAVVKRILSLSNNIVKHFTFEELFPDRA